MLVIYVFSVLFSRSVPILSNLVVVALTACVLLVVVQSDWVPMTRLQFGVLGCLALAAAWFLFATLYAEDPVRHFTSTKTLVLLFSVTIASVLVMRSHERARYVWVAIAGATALVGLLSVLVLTTGLPIGAEPLPPRTYGLPIPPIPRVLGVRLPFGFYGVLASISSSFLLSLLMWPRVFYPRRRPTRIRIAAMALLGSVILAVLLTRSRSSFLALAVVLGLFGIVGLVWVADRLNWLLIGVASGAFVGLLAQPSVALLRSVVFSQRGSLEARLNQYALAYDLIVTNPLFGTGAGSFISRSEFFIHNFWLTIGTWSGIPGLFLWILVFVFLFWRCVRYLRVSDLRVRVWGLAMLGAFSGGTIELMLFPGFNDAPAILLAAVAGPSMLFESSFRPVERATPIAGESHAVEQT